MKQKLILFMFFPVLMLLLAASVSTEREENTVPGKIIVQFKPGIEKDISNFINSYAHAGIKAERCLSADLNIWLLSFDNKKYAVNAIVQSIKKDETIAQAQPEHYISIREVFPNDPSFAMQWALYNIGQTGGTDDADIDATLAWDVSVNNGATVMGDTIVIAVIDDGFYLAHEDMNYWKNRNEIPANGIDDDGNGYVDDFDGWNAYASSGEINSKSHGTMVSGVAGAVGDNNTGISGVGWNTRILPVAGSSTFEATVVEAFGYVYKMRSLYDETNGIKGAYIIATNGSFGVDFANPDDYPIWHTMYDSLGSLGILSAAATMNRESDVEVDGDVPTNFDTDYLIGVTNTTKKDEKYATAAWGKVSIDLGAPGSSVLSTRPNDAYGYSTGTSFSSPHVAGSIGLLFAAAGTDFLETYHDKPSETAIFLKNVLLEGVDTLSGFDTLCTSGGRLNVNNAVQILLSPRIEMPETLSYQLAPDSTGSYSLLISNLMGFNLPFECYIVTTPSWLSCTQSSGLIPADGNVGLHLNFDASGLLEGSYQNQLIVVDAGGREYVCNIELEVIPGLGISNNEPFDSHVICYPNPFTDVLTLDIPAETGSSSMIYLYGINGEAVFERSYTEKMIPINTAHLPAGIYILSVESEGIFRQMKLVKH
jgi:hypothetical protein